MTCGIIVVFFNWVSKIEEEKKIYKNYILVVHCTGCDIVDMGDSSVKFQLI